MLYFVLSLHIIILCIILQNVTTIASKKHKNIIYLVTFECE